MHFGKNLFRGGWLFFLTVATFVSVSLYCSQRVVTYRHSECASQENISRHQTLNKTTNDMGCKRFLKRKKVDCLPIYEGNITAIEKSKEIPFKPLIYHCMLPKLILNCTELINAHNYITDPKDLSKDEIEYPLAFTIKMHTNADQAEQLLRNIYRPQNVYCIYIDRKSIKQIFHIMRNLSKCFTNVFVVEGRKRITYASIDLVHAEMECMKVLINKTVKWKYYINLTGQEFPLKTNFEMVKILKSLQGANDIEAIPFPDGLRRRIKYKHKRVKNALVQTNITKPPFLYNISMKKGSAYVMLTYDFVRFMLDDPIAKMFVDWLNDTYSPEETVFATLNSVPWAPGGYNLTVSERSKTFLSRAVKWQYYNFKCGGKWARAVCVYGPEDVPWLLDQPQIIANKFNIEVDTIAVDCLEEAIQYRTKYSGSSFLRWNYYKNLPHVQLYSNTNKTLHFNKLSYKRLKWMEEQHKIQK